jgi:ADP-ribosyl-[dinitrogen reductase] hydrolase
MQTSLPSFPDLDADQVDRARGALLGLAVGDALGTTLEFSARDTLPHHTEITGGGPFHLKPGQWTDDTSMALALADSLIQHPELDARDLMDRFVRWWRESAYSCTGTCFDIGVATAGALRQYHHRGEPYAGSTDPQTAGNGIADAPGAGGSTRVARGRDGPPHRGGSEPHHP